MGLKIKVDGVEQKTNTMASNNEINNETTERIWEVMNENAELKQQVVMLNAKLDRVKDILNQ